MNCKCGLRGDHFTCNQCGMHVGVKSEACIGCRGFRFSAFPVVNVTVDTTETTPALEPLHTKPQPATHARRARTARA